MMVELPDTGDDSVKETVRLVLVLLHVTPEVMFAPPLKFKLQVIDDEP